jgi:acyl-[acyl-carrier-protein] desaturase
MHATRIRAAIRPVVELLLDRHFSTAHEWFPHEYVPWERGVAIDSSRSWDDDPGVDPIARIALVLNLLTEDNLPLYFAEIHRHGEGDDAWHAWARRWAAEEGRHSIVIRDYLMVTRAVDPIALERGRMRQVSSGSAPAFDMFTDALVYTTLQELATRISHRNTGKLLADRVGVALMTRVANDENLHHLFYRDVTAAAIDVAPSEMVRAIDRTVRTFAMPGTGIADFDRHARAIAKAGVYNMSIHHDQILVPVVLHQWRLENLSGLDDDAERARDQILRHLDRLARVARRVERRSDEESATVAV